MDNLSEIMTVLEKIQSLLKSRRFWMYFARSVVGIIALVAMISPVLGVDAPDVPDEEALTDQMAKAVEHASSILGAAIALLALLVDGKHTGEQFTHRPPGVDDRGGDTVNITYTE